MREDAAVLGAEVEERRDGAVDGDVDEPDGEAAGDGEDGVFRPGVGSQCGLAEDGDERGGVDGGAPDPVAGDGAVGEDQVAAVDSGGDVVDYQGVVEAVGDPGPEGGHAEEDGLLGEVVELGVAVEEAGGDELVEYAKGEGGEDGEEDVVEGEGPGFVDDGAGEAVLEGVL